MQKEDATLAVWANELQAALATLHQVLKELNTSLGRHQPVPAVESSTDLSDCLGGSDAESVPFEDYIHDFDSATPIGKSSNDSAYLEAQRLALRSKGPDDDFEGLYPISRANLFDSLSSTSPMLGESVSSYMLVQQDTES